MFTALYDSWPIIAWATTIVFFTGGAWFTLWGLRQDFKDIKPLIQRVPVLDAKMDGLENELIRVRDRVHDANNTAQEALLTARAANGSD